MFLSNISFFLPPSKIGNMKVFILPDNEGPYVVKTVKHQTIVYDMN